MEPRLTMIGPTVLLSEVEDRFAQGSARTLSACHISAPVIRHCNEMSVTHVSLPIAESFSLDCSTCT